MTLVSAEKIENTRTKRNANKKEFIVRSVFVGDKELKDIIWKVAEAKTIREMGLAV